MKKTNKKGFTIVELVIVIAVIAILAAVLIPTFAGVVEKANKSADLQAAKNAYTEDLAEFDGVYTAAKQTELATANAVKGSFTFTDGAVTTYVYVAKNYKLVYLATAETALPTGCSLISGVSSPVAGWNFCTK